MAELSIRVDPVALANLVRSPSGGVFRETIRVAQRVETLARDRVGVSQNNPAGHLRDAIVKRVQADGGVRVGIFGSLGRRALYHHNGTRPHRIQGRPLLRFFWPKAGRVVVFRHVNHPGTKPNPFLTSALRDVFAGL